MSLIKSEEIMTVREQVRKLEESLPVEELNVTAFGKKFQVYPWLKGRLFHKLIVGVETKQERNFGLYWKQLTSIFYGIFNLFGKYDIWMYTTSMERRMVNGKYTDKLFDYVGNELKWKSLIIESRILNYYPRRKVASKHVISRSFFLLFEELYGRIFLRKIQVNNPELLEQINAHVDGGVASRLLIRKYLSQYRMTKFWLKVLPNPKIVMMSVAYTNFGAILAFKEKGIKVIEMQHGVITDNHHAYNYFKKFESNQFPDTILTIGTKEKLVFNKGNQFPVSEIIPVGSYIIDQTLSEKSRGIQKNIILFTLQDGSIAEKFFNFILELKKEIGQEYQFLIQPRHVTKEEYVQQIPEVEELEFSTEHFYKAAIKSDCHVTIYSTTAIESLSLGTPNILIDIEGKATEQLQNTLGNNIYTAFVQTTQEFQVALSQLVNSERELVIKSNEENIMPGFKDNIRSFLNSELK